MRPTLPPILDEGALTRIHEKSLDLLERVGIIFHTHEALDLLRTHGCPVDYERSWASLPQAFVRWALEQAPRVITLEARDPGQSITLDGTRSYHTTDSQGTRAADPDSGEIRPSTLEDLELGLRLADALDQVAIVNVLVAANDVPAHLRNLQHFASAFTQTGKHVRCGVLDPRLVDLLVELTHWVTGETAFRPIFSTVDCTISPLMHDGPMTEACLRLAKLGVPIMVYPMPLAGGTAPVTLAGTVLVHNIEFLSGLALFQAANPGTPIIYGTGASQLDMATGAFGGSADGQLLRLALRDLARFYDLPVNMWGLSTASRQLDALYGHEATANTLFSQLAGADEIFSIGLMGDAQILSLDKLVLDNHFARQTALMCETLEVSGETLRAELIEAVGIGGSYLTRRETRDDTRRFYVPKWPTASPDWRLQIQEERRSLLEIHQPMPLPEGAHEEIAGLLARADAMLQSTPAS